MVRQQDSVEARYARSREYWRHASELLPGGVTSSIRLAEQPHPLCFVRGHGPEIEDADGNRYIDYVCGYGPVILGHDHPHVSRAVLEAISAGQLFGSQHPLEMQVAERVHAAVPSMEVMRFCSSGSEAVHAAIRIARAATGRITIVRFDGHYHGWLDSIYAAPLEETDRGRVARAGPGSRGQPPSALAEVVVLHWNDLEAVSVAGEELHGQLAAVILEPILCNTGVVPPRPGFLEALRQWCDRESALLIFDEVITGFRVALGGAQHLMGARPDLSVFGKALANGFPIGVVGGRRDFMTEVADGRVMHAGTFNGNVATMAAARATLDILAVDGGEVYGSMTLLGLELMAGLRHLASQAGLPVLLQGPGPVFHVWFTDCPAIEDAQRSRSVDTSQYSRFCLAMLRRGIRLIPNGRWYLTTAHTSDHVSRTLEAAGAAMHEIAMDMGP